MSGMKIVEIILDMEQIFFRQAGIFGVVVEL